MKVYITGMTGESAMEKHAWMLVAINFLELHDIINQRMNVHHDYKI